MGIRCGSEGAKTELQSTYPIALRCRQKIHEVAGCLPVFLAFERHIEIGGGPEHVQERPQCKALAPVLLEAEIDRDPTIQFLAKPFSLRGLASKVKEVIAG